MRSYALAGKKGAEYKQNGIVEAETVPIPNAGNKDVGDVLLRTERVGNEARGSDGANISDLSGAPPPSPTFCAPSILERRPSSSCSSCTFPQLLLPALAFPVAHSHHSHVGCAGNIGEYVAVPHKASPWMWALAVCGGTSRKRCANVPNRGKLRSRPCVFKAHIFSPCPSHH